MQAPLQNSKGNTSEQWPEVDADWRWVSYAVAYCINASRGLSEIAVRLLFMQHISRCIF